MATEDPTAEIWKPIPNATGYEASSFGRIRTVPRMVRGKCDGKQFKPGVILKPRIVRNYQQIQVSIGGTQKGMKVHRLVLAAFVREAKAGESCNHKDCNKLNNRPENLEWVTPKQNTAHAFANGRMNVPKGERHHNSRLTADAIRDIRARAAAGENHRTIAADHGVSRPTVSPIASRKQWKHVE